MDNDDFHLIGKMITLKLEAIQICNRKTPIFSNTVFTKLGI